MSILTVAGFVLLGLVLLAGSCAPIGVFGWVMSLDDDDHRPRARVWVASAVLSFVCIVLAVWIMARTGDDPSSHCGPGTRYVSEEHLVGKTIVTDWLCVAP